MTTLTGRAAEFLALHTPGKPFLQLNAFDVGSARILASLGIKAIATTSSGVAGTLGRHDGQMQLDETLEHCAALSAAVPIPVAADFENGFADDPEQVAANVIRAASTGLAGLSIEDWSGTAIYGFDHAVARVAAAAEAAHENNLVLTARAENLIHGVDDFADCVKRAQAFQDAGADVIFVPGVRTVADVAALVGALTVPVNVLALAGTPPLAELAAAGVARISVGGGLMYAAYAAVIDAATELRDHGTLNFWEAANACRDAVRGAFG